LDIIQIIRRKFNSFGSDVFFEPVQFDGLIGFSVVWRKPSENTAAVLDASAPGFALFPDRSSWPPDHSMQIPWERCTEGFYATSLMLPWAWRLQVLSHRRNPSLRLN
jgi:hypothetical protein